MPRHIYKIVLLFVLIITGSFLHAQVYPVQVTTQLTPPYSLYLSDYVASGTERLSLNIFLGDIARPELLIKLRLRIIGQGQNIVIETRPDYNPPPIAIQGGVPLRLISADIADYFNPDNLNFQGISKRQYQQQGKLPEGVYQFCFEVLEYNRGSKISNTGCGTAWMILNDPPIINLPRQAEKIKALSPQNVVLQWTPRHTGSPNSAFTTEYEVKMVEIWPATRNPNDAILTSPTIFEATTQNTTLIYGPAETPLELGRKYAFRVRAKSMVGVDELDLFKNQGYSETYSFTYGDACDLPTGISVQPYSNRLDLKWDSKFNHTSFNVRYRKVGTTEWYTSNSTFNEASITSLRPSTLYEYQVAGTCGWFEGEYTTVATIKTKDAPVATYSCGIPIETFNMDPSQLIGSLKVGDIIMAGDFDVEATKVTGSDGVFTGEGVVVMPMLNKVKVKTVFTNITVNKEMRMIKGFMNVTGTTVNVIPDQILNLVGDLNELLDKADKALDQAEESLDKIDAALSIVDEVLKNVMAYLPDDIIKQINDAKASMSIAKSEMRSATTPEAKAEAKAKVKAAKEELKAGVGNALAFYAEAIKQLVNIIITSLKELAEEAIQNKDDVKATYESNRSDLSQLVDNSNSALAQGAPSNNAESEFVFIEETSYKLTQEEVKSKLNADPDFKAYHDKTRSYLESFAKYNLTVVIEGLAKVVVDKEKIEQFNGLLKNEGIDVLEQIGLKLKQREEERSIIEYTKMQIVISLTKVIDKTLIK